MNPVRILILEDEMIIAEAMAQKLEAMGYEVVGLAISHDEAIELLKEQSPDIALLDIHLNEEKSGIDVAEYIRSNMSIPFIFITSNTGKGVLELVKRVKPNGYLVKPYKKEDLFVSIELAIVNFMDQQPNPQEQLLKDFIFVREDHCYRKIPHAEIRWLKAEGNYTMIHTSANRSLVRGKLKELLELLPKNFFRLHKSYAVNLPHIDLVKNASVNIGEQEIPIGKMYRDELLSYMNMV